MGSNAYHTIKVVIVAKTRRGRGACVGGVTFDGRSVRLEAIEASFNEQAGQAYNIGDVWEVDYVDPPTITPPHVENIIVHGKRRLSTHADLLDLIHQHMPPKIGGIDCLYEGLTGATSAGALYIAERLGIPPYSTQFWIPDQPLVRDTDGKRIRYRYPTADGGRTLTFVGFQEPVAEIPAGSLLRVSLAHWWRPEEMPDGEPRCYVQLSGWLRLGGPVADSMEKRPFPHPLLKTAQQQLKSVFGYDELRPLQAEIIENVLRNRDALVIMPTGSGKSLCYQLPALLSDGLTVVVSPLISLMQDQVNTLRELGVTAVYLNSSLSYDEYHATANLVRQGEVKLLYVAPETLLRPETLLLLEQNTVTHLAIDEAHCISEWGHDFRPEYRQLSAVRQLLPDASCIALTATATPRVRADIRRTLDLPQADEFVASFDRPNLFLSAQPRTDGLAQIVAFLKDHRDASGIIYCATRRQVDTLTHQLQSLGWEALPYHAGLDSQTRHRHQNRFSRDDVPIMVATVAFGMGIDKSNVRFIIHYDLPKDVESYYQQIGRAGRDGLRADCLLLYTHGDVQTIHHFIEQKAIDEQRGAKLRLQAMLGFAEATVCRRLPLLRYFDELYEADGCDFCDNCQADERALTDVTIPAQKFFSCVKRTGEIYGMTHVIDVLRGSKAKKLLDRGHDQLSTYGIGREFSKKQWQHLARQFIQQRLLDHDLEHGSLKLTADAWAVMRGERPVFAELLAERPSSTTTAALDHDADLFAQLRAKRKALADAADVPPFVIFSDRSLVEMATYFPQTLPAFAEIYGVGEQKLKKYAPEFLPIIQTYCQENQIAEQEKGITPRPITSGGERMTAVITLYKHGQSINDIATQLSIQPRTVLKHLWKAVQTGVTLPADKLLAESTLSPEMQQRVLDAFAELGVDFLRPVYDALEEAVDWQALHLMRLYVVCQRAI